MSRLNQYDPVHMSRLRSSNNVKFRSVKYTTMQKNYTKLVVREAVTRLSGNLTKLYRPCHLFTIDW